MKTYPFHYAKKLKLTAEFSCMRCTHCGERMIMDDLEEVIQACDRMEKKEAQ